MATEGSQAKRELNFKMGRREFWNRILGTFGVFFGTIFGIKKVPKPVSYRFSYAAVVLDGPKDPLALYKYYKKMDFPENKFLKEAAERLGKNAALDLDRKLREVINNG